MGKIERVDGSGTCWHILANLDERSSGYLLRRRQYSRFVYLGQDGLNNERKIRLAQRQMQSFGCCFGS